jgi:hypothetical protein
MTLKKMIRKTSTEAQKKPFFSFLKVNVFTI